MADAANTLHEQDHAAPFKTARVIYLIGLTLTLGYLIILGGTYLKGNFLVDGSPAAKRVRPDPRACSR